MQTMDYTEYIKVNMPRDKAGYKSGNGEGVWARLKKCDYEKYLDDKNRGEIMIAKLENDSLYYPGLEVGMTMPIVTRGGNRPVVSFSWLQEKFGECELEF